MCVGGDEREGERALGKCYLAKSEVLLSPGDAQGNVCVGCAVGRLTGQDAGMAQRKEIAEEPRRSLTLVPHVCFVMIQRFIGEERINWSS